jgi:hypothetical protein
MHCRHFVPPPLSRRDMLLRCASGFGAVALSALLREPAFGAVLGEAPAGPMDIKPGHHPPRARSVIFLYMDGGWRCSAA